MAKLRTLAPANSEVGKANEPISTREIVLEVGPDGLILWDAPPSILPVLCAPSYSVVSDYRGHHLKKCGKPLFWPFHRFGQTLLNPIALPFGMLPVVMAVLELLGLRYRRRGYTPWRHLDVIAAGLVGKSVVGGFVATDNLGIIRCCGPATRDQVIARICEQLPTLEIGICTASNSQCLDIIDRLNAIGLGSRVQHSEHPRYASGNILVGTSAKLVNRKDSRSLTIFAGVAGTRAPFASDAYQKSVRSARVIVFGSHEDRAPRDAAVVRAWFGFRELHVARVNEQIRPVNVASVRIASPPPTDATNQVLADIQQTQWHNGLRNRLIAAAARKIAGQYHGKTVADGVLYQLTGEPANRRVVVLVESPEHAADLAERLPGWPILAGHDVQVDRVPQRWQGTLRHLMTDNLHTRTMIATFAAAASWVNWRAVDLVIRCDGGSALPPIPTRALATTELTPSPLLVVDVHDCASTAGREQFRLRQKCYADAGWFRLGADPPAERFVAFMHSLLAARSMP